MLNPLVSLCTGLLLLAVSVSAAAQSWQPNREADARDQVSTWTRDVPDSPVKAFRGVVEVPHGPVPVLAAITAVDTFPEWIFQVQASEAVPDTGGERTYMRFNGIWPVSDRDVVLDNSVSQAPESGAVTLHSVNAEGARPPSDGYVRIPALNNRFVVTPLADGWTRVEFRTFVDPGGKVPVWLANLVATKGQSGRHQGAAGDAGRAAGAAGEAALQERRQGRPAGGLRRGSFLGPRRPLSRASSGCLRGCPRAGCRRP